VWCREGRDALRGAANVLSLEIIMRVQEITFATRYELEEYLEALGFDVLTISIFSLGLFGDESCF